MPREKDFKQTLCADIGEGSRALTWGDLALRLFCEAAAKPKADHSGSEKSAEVVVAGASRKAGKAR